MSLGFTHYTPRDAQWRRTFPPRPVLYLLSRNAPNGAVTPYWLRPHISSSEHPLVFLHGIGVRVATAFKANPLTPTYM